jgi:hypothetical protein
VIPEQTGSCLVRDALRAQVRAELRVYLDRITDLQQNIGKTFKAAHLEVDHARKAYQTAREKLNEHTATHRCAQLMDPVLPDDQ